MIRKLTWFNKTYFNQKFNREIAQKYFKYTLMSLVSAATVPVSQLLLRGYVISKISPVEAGWWEGMNRISNMYLMVITTSFSVYYLPRLAEIKENKELKNEIFKSYKFIIPLLLLGFTLIYLFRFIIIKILFTTQFLPMENLFFWQLIGDFFKIASWLLAFLMVAKSMTKAYISTEIIFAVLLVGLGFVFMNVNGVVGITQAYTITYVLYLLSMLFIFRKLVFAK
jgi:PST family polysaccharide transporter